MGCEDRLYPLLRTYERLPQSIQRLIGSSYRVLIESARLSQFYTKFRNETHAREKTRPDNIRAYQLDRVREITSYAYEPCPFYRERFDRFAFKPEVLDDLEALKACPTVSKEDNQEKLGEDFSICLTRVKAVEKTSVGKHRWLVSSLRDETPDVMEEFQ